MFNKRALSFTEGFCPWAIPCTNNKENKMASRKPAKKKPTVKRPTMPTVKKGKRAFILIQTELTVPIRKLLEADRIILFNDAEQVQAQIIQIHVNVDRPSEKVEAL